MEGASLLAIPSHIRMLFASICLWSCPTDPLQLYNKFLDYLIEDYQQYTRRSNHQVPDRAGSRFQQGKNCIHIGLPQPMQLHQRAASVFNVQQEAHFSFEEYASMINAEQSNVVKRVLDLVHRILDKKAFFIDGPGGTGKTFCYSVITHRQRAQGKRIISVAWTGIAATLLLDGSTVHNINQTPININETTTSSMNMKSKKAYDLRKADLIVWDEAPMSPLHALNGWDLFKRKMFDFVF